MTAQALILFHKQATSAPERDVMRLVYEHILRRLTGRRLMARCTTAASPAARGRDVPCAADA